VAFWKAESELYRLVVVARHYIDLLPIDSTRERIRKRAAWSKPTSNFRTFRKRGRVDDTTATTTITTVNINVANHSSASLRSSSHNTLLDDQPIMMDWHGRRSQKAPALISDVMTVGTSSSIPTKNAALKTLKH